ncbi:MAG: flagellar motor switch protein FliN [Candidatus Dadabacteria bacterium]|nr:MAG: flagellar motor switch protein FliN [Candidatus Dadabacteria bacterium]
MPDSDNSQQDNAETTEGKGYTLEFLNDVPLGISVEFGRNELNIRRLLQLDRGSVIELEKLANEPLDIRVNGKLIARGEIVVVNDKYGIRVTQIMDPEGLDGLMGE